MLIWTGTECEDILLLEKKKKKKDFMETVCSSLSLPSPERCKTRW